MAKQEELALLRRGVWEWNQWRETNSYLRPDLSDADLRAARLGGAYLYRADLRGTRLDGARLSDADLRSAHLSGASLKGARLDGANLRGADLSEADLSEADLRRANLSDASLRGTNLSEANLGAADLRETDLGETILAGTILGGLDLREAFGLETAQHCGPSYISIDTIYRSEGQIPEDFLRGAGVPETFIEYIRSFVIKPTDYYTCSIGYASKDKVFAQRLYADLQQERIRCWLASEQAKVGNKTNPCSDKLLLVFSEHSITSSWMKREVEAAFERERLRREQVLFPLALDGAVEHATQIWAATLRSRKRIGDFTRWQQRDDYQRAFERLLRDLRAET